MDGMLNNRIAKWVNEFSRGSLEKDSYHIDELLEIDCPKNNWSAGRIRLEQESNKS